MQTDSKRKCNLLLIRWDLAIYSGFLLALVSQPLNCSSTLSLFIRNCRYSSDSPLEKTKRKRLLFFMISGNLGNLVLDDYSGC